MKCKILLLTIFLSACSAAQLPAPDVTPQASPVLIQAAAAVETATPGPTATATPNAMALAQAQHDEAQKTSDAAAIIVAQQGALQAGINATEKAAGISATKTLEAGHATAQHDQGEQQIRLANATAAGLSAITNKQLADNDKARLELLAENEATKRKQADYAMVIGLVIAVLVCACTIIILRLFSVRSLEYQVALASQEDEERAAAVSNTPGDMLPIPPARSIPLSDTTSDADVIPPHGADKFARFLREWALLSRPLGINSVKAAGYYSQPDYTDVLVWLGKKEALRRAIDPNNGHARFPSLYDVSEFDNSRILSGCAGGGMQWAEDWLDKHAPPSPIASDTPIQPPPADTVISNTAIPAEGGGDVPPEQEMHRE